MGPPTLWPHSWGAVLAVLGGATGPNEMRAELGGQRHGGEDGRVDGPRTEVNGVGDKCQRYLAGGGPLWER